MRSIVLRFGLISGIIIITLSSMHWLFFHSMEQMMSMGMIITYVSMIIALSMVYVGVRRYRDTVLGGTITFWQALGCGALIALISAAFYIVGWEITLATAMPDFATKYAAAQIHQLEVANASAATIAEAKVAMADFVDMYANPVIRMGFTFLEIVPVGLLATLVSAAILRRRVQSV
jgi:hypothetical protein